jgi:hypothetical protein
MNSATIQANNTLRVPYDVPSASSTMFNFRVLSPDAPVNVFIVDSDALAQYDAGQTSFATWGQSRDRRDHALQVPIPPRARLYLLIENRTAKSIHVDYEAVLLPPILSPTGPAGFGRFR